MHRLFTGIAEGVGNGLSQPLTETEQTGAGGEVHGGRNDGFFSLAPGQGQANR